MKKNQHKTDIIFIKERIYLKKKLGSLREMFENKIDSIGKESKYNAFITNILKLHGKWVDEHMIGAPSIVLKEFRTKVEHLYAIIEFYKEVDPSLVSKNFEEILWKNIKDHSLKPEEKFRKILRWVKTELCVPHQINDRLNKNLRTFLLSLFPDLNDEELYDFLAVRKL